VVANRVPIFYNPAVFRCVDSGILKLTEEYSFERSENKRTVSWAILEDVTDSITRGTKIAVFNSHWSIKEYNGTSYAEIRATQSREMQALINDPKFADLPRVVCGDFNALYNEEILQELLNNCGLAHADVAVNGRVTWNSVDHIGVTGAWITSYTVRRDIRLASDHPPIYVDLIV
jgi:endonuclease/exonuclease/phosphatase family metal-dependent hydrolase